MQNMITHQDETVSLTCMVFECFANDHVSIWALTHCHDTAPSIAKYSVNSLRISLA